MVLGMSLSAFTMLHVALSLLGIVTGLVVMFGLLGSRRKPGWTAVFLLSTILTSASGFLFPFTKLLPSHMVGIVSLVLLAVAVIALYLFRLTGMSVSEWIWDRRLHRCHDLLTRPELHPLSLTEIAYRMGFNSSSHFSTAFRKKYGLSPSELRKR